jgi:hypothetical protein
MGRWHETSLADPGSGEGAYVNTPPWGSARARSCSRCRPPPARLATASTSNASTAGRVRSRDHEPQDRTPQSIESALHLGGGGDGSALGRCRSSRVATGSTSRLSGRGRRKWPERRCGIGEARLAWSRVGLSWWAWAMVRPRSRTWTPSKAPWRSRTRTALRLRALRNWRWRGSAGRSGAGGGCCQVPQAMAAAALWTSGASWAALRQPRISPRTRSRLAGQGCVGRG